MSASATPASPSSRERGSILVELLFLMVVVTIPLFYLVATLAQAQAGAFAANAAAREAGRAFVTAENEDLAYARAQAAAEVAIGPHGFDRADLMITLNCRSGPCLAPGSVIQIDVEVSVDLPLVPDVISTRVPARVVLHAEHIEVVDEFRGTG